MPTEDCFSPIERAIREVCHTRKLSQPDIWEDGGEHTAGLYVTPEFRADYSKEGDDRYAPETLSIRRLVETIDGDTVREVRVKHSYVGGEPVITASISEESMNVTFKGMKQESQVKPFIRAAQELVGVHNGRAGKDEVDRQFLTELVGDFYDLIEVAQMYFKPVEDNGYPAVSES